MELKTGNEIVIYTLQMRAACLQPEAIPFDSPELRCACRLFAYSETTTHLHVMD